MVIITLNMYFSQDVTALKKLVLHNPVSIQCLQDTRNKIHSSNAIVESF